MANWNREDDDRALRSYDDLAHFGYGERDDLRDALEADNGWRDERDPEEADDA